MNQLQDLGISDTEKLRFLKAFLSEDHIDAYKKDFGLDKESSFYFHTFAPFCRAYANFLLNNGSLTYYGSFIESFNDLIKRDQAYKHYKEAQNSLINTHGGLAFLNFNYDQTLIEDARYKISDKKFRLESDLEYLMYSELKSFYDAEIDIKTQQYHGYGRCDITVNNNIALELKKGKARRKDVYQTFEYSFDNQIKEVALIASDFDKDTLQIANKLKVDCFTYCFMYEDYDINGQYPIGFVLEKINKETENTLFARLISEMDAFWISFYRPNFSFKEEFEKEYQKNMEIHDRTKQIINHNKQHALSQAEKLGFDTSQGFEKLISQLKEQE